MARFAAGVESQAAQPAGAPSGVTFNGYFAALVAGAANGYVLRRIVLGVRTTSGTVSSQQQTVELRRQTVRVAGTGFSTTTGVNTELYTTASGITGIDITTAAAAGTTGPTVGNPLHKFTFNTQTGWDLPAELLEQWTCLLGTANGLAFVNIGNALPANHIYTLSLEWEE